MATAAQVTNDTVALVRECHYNPLKFVLKMYPWEHPGSWLQHDKGPDRWQAEMLTWLGEETKLRHFDGHTPVMPIRKAVSKGHGVGGSVMAAWLTDWIMSTRPHSQGVVTANTSLQLETKTWAAISRWTQACLTAPWFQINSARMYHKQFPKSWFCTPQTCREENSEAFAGQHAKDSTSFYIFDEDSAIPTIIHTVAEGGMTDGEPMMFRFGNCTRNNGDFYDCCFGKLRDYWAPTIVDSRGSRFSNKALIDQWIELHGEDSDFVRVRVRGLPPRASDSQFIDSDRVRKAQTREIVTFEDEPLIAGADFSGGGQAWNVVRFRRGMDARSRPPIRVAGEKTRSDRSAYLATLAALMRERNPELRVAALFCDSAFGSPYVERLRQMGFTNVFEVNFGGESPDPVHYLNHRAYMHGMMREWLLVGAIDDSAQLEADLTAPGSTLTAKDQIVIESKKQMADRGVQSPDESDALALTFAAPVQQLQKDRRPPARRDVFAGAGPQAGNRLGWLK